MNAKTSLLVHYKSLGIEITANGDKLRLLGPELVLTPQIQIEIRNQRACIFSELDICNEELIRNEKSPPIVHCTCSMHSEQIGLDDHIPHNPFCQYFGHMLRPELINWIYRTKSATTLADLKKVLEEFATGEWKLLDRRDLSEAYTPVALRLISSDGANKWQTLEHLAPLCWMPAQSS